MSDSMTRRGFVKSVGYGGVAATALAGLTAADGVEPQSATKSAAGRLSTEKIRIGTLVQASVPGGPANYIRQILPHGFESFSVDVSGNTWATSTCRRWPRKSKEVLGASGAVISSVGIYGNPLVDTKWPATRDGWRQLIDAAGLFGCDIVAGFAGRVVDKPVPESMPRFAEVFGAAGQAGGRQGRAAGLRELRDGRQLAARRLEHRPQSRPPGR